jgi:hypothetical protein
MDTLLLVDYDITVQYYLYRYVQYIDQCKDTYCKEESGYHAYRYKLKEKDAKHCRYIWRIVRSETECSVASASNVFLNGRSPAVSRTVSVGG